MTSFPFPEVIIERIGWLLLHSLWQFTLLGGLAGVLFWLLRGSRPAVRYALGLGFLVAIVLCPIATWPFIPVEVPAPSPIAPPAPAAPITVTPTFIPDPSLDPPPTARNLPAETEHLSPHTLPPVVAPAAPIPWAQQLKIILTPWLETCVALWCAGVLLFSLRPLIGWFAQRRLRQIGTHPLTEQVAETWKRAQERLKIRQRVEFLQSTLAPGSMVVGYLRPVILLPTTVVNSLPARRIEAILLHELAHIRRHDWLVNTLQTLVETLFFHHPAVWWLSARIRHERELCCDEIAAHALGDRVEYGRALLDLENLRDAPLLALSARGGSLLDRIRRLTRTDVPRSNSTALVSLGLAALLLGSLGVWGGQNAAGTPPGRVDDTVRRTDDTPWGPESSGLRVRIIPVSPDTDPLDKIPVQPVNQFATSTEMAFLVELENVSDRALYLPGVYNSPAFPIKPEPFSSIDLARLFEIELTDVAGNPASGLKRQFADTILRQVIHPLEPGDAVRLVLAPGRFHQPLDYQLPPGEYTARISYVGLQEDFIPLAPGGTETNAKSWRGKATSNATPFSIQNPLPPHVAANELVWGPEVNGLRAAVEFRRPPTDPPTQLKLNHVPINSNLQPFIHIQNVSDTPIDFASENWRQNDQLVIKDRDGKRLDVVNVFYTSFPTLIRWTINPGEIAEIPAADIGIAADKTLLDQLPDPVGYRWITKPGEYTLQLKVRSDTVIENDDTGISQTFPLPTDWHGELQTGEVALTIVEQAADPQTEEPNPEKGPPTDADANSASASAENVTITGQVVDNDGRPITGAFVVFAPIFEDDGTRREFTATTDNQGAFQLECPGSALGEDPRSSHITVWAWKEGFAIGTASAGNLRDRATTHVHLVLPPKTPRRFLVLDPDQNPVISAHVSPRHMRVPNGNDPVDGLYGLYDQIPPALQQKIRHTTDAKGVVWTDTVPNQQFEELTVSTEDFGTQHFSAGSNELILSKVGDIQGVVQNTKEPMHLLIESDNKWRGWGVSIVATDHNGNFHVSKFPVGQALVRPYKYRPSRESESGLIQETLTKVVPGTNSVLVRREKGILIRGRIVERDTKTGIFNARFSLRTGYDEEFNRYPKSTTEVVTDKNGVFETLGAPGNASLQVFTLGRELKYPKPLQFQIPADKPEFTLADIEVDRAKIWTGKLIDEHEQPIVGVYVAPMARATNQVPERAISGKSRRLTHPARTNGDGHFSLTTEADASPDDWQVVWFWEGGNETTSSATVVSQDPLILRAERRRDNPDSQSPNP